MGQEGDIVLVIALIKALQQPTAESSVALGISRLHQQACVIRPKVWFFRQVRLEGLGKACDGLLPQAHFSADIACGRARPPKVHWLAVRLKLENQLPRCRLRLRMSVAQQTIPPFQTLPKEAVSLIVLPLLFEDVSQLIHRNDDIGMFRSLDAAMDFQAL